MRSLLNLCGDSTLEKIRTSDLNVRNVALYPTELRERRITCILLDNA
jgi:hypothetical protein